MVRDNAVSLWITITVAFIAQARQFLGLTLLRSSGMCLTNRSFILRLTRSACETAQQCFRFYHKEADILGHEERGQGLERTSTLSATKLRYRRSFVLSMDIPDPYNPLFPANCFRSLLCVSHTRFLV